MCVGLFIDRSAVCACMCICVCARACVRKSDLCGCFPIVIVIIIITIAGSLWRASDQNKKERSERASQRAQIISVVLAV